MRRIALQLQPQLIETDDMGLWPCTGRHGAGPTPLLPSNRLDRLFQGGADRNLHQRFASSGIVGATGTPGPVGHDAPGQDLLILKRRHHLERPQGERFGCTGDVVQVQIRDRRSDGRPVFIDDRIMNQGDVQIDA